MKHALHVWPNHFLRDDYDIRHTANIQPHQAYSLFRKEPYGRIAVLAGDYDWALSEARKLVADDHDTA